MSPAAAAAPGDSARARGASSRFGSLALTRRIIVLLAIGQAAACSSTLEPPSGDLRQDLRHRDPRVRVLATRDAVQPANADRRDLVPLLIANLADRDDSVRLFSLVALRKLTGEDHGYAASADISARTRAIARWRAWALEQGFEIAGGDSELDASTDPPPEPPADFRAEELAPPAEDREDATRLTARQAEDAHE